MLVCQVLWNFENPARGSSSQNNLAAQLIVIIHVGLPVHVLTSNIVEYFDIVRWFDYGIGYKKCFKI